MTSTPTRPVDNVVLTTKGLHDTNNLLLDGRTVENKGKLILTKYLSPCKWLEHQKCLQLRKICYSMGTGSGSRLGW